MVLIFPPEPSKECVKVSHVIFECRVINHHPKMCKNNSWKFRKQTSGEGVVLGIRTNPDRGRG